MQGVELLGWGGPGRLMNKNAETHCCIFLFVAGQGKNENTGCCSEDEVNHKYAAATEDPSHHASPPVDGRSWWICG